MTERSFHQLVALLHCRSLHKVLPGCLLTLPLSPLPLCFSSLPFHSLSHTLYPLPPLFPPTHLVFIFHPLLSLKASKPLKAWNESPGRPPVP